MKDAVPKLLNYFGKKYKYKIYERISHKVHVVFVHVIDV